MNKVQESIARSFARAAASYDKNALVQRQIVQRLVDYLPQGERYNYIFEFGCGTGLLTQALRARISANHWILNDLSRPIVERASQYLQHQKFTLLAGDASEQLNQINTPLDLIASASALQWLGNPFQFLHRAAKHLTPEGTLLLSTFGERNLHELRSLTGRGLEYFPVERYRTFGLQRFLHVEVEEEEVVLRFSSLIDLLHHLRATGVTHLPNDNVSYLCGRARLAQLEKEYTAMYAHPQGGLSLTYHPIYIKCSCKATQN